MHMLVGEETSYEKKMNSEAMVVGWLGMNDTHALHNL